MNLKIQTRNKKAKRMAEEEKTPGGGKKLPPKPPLPPRRAATANSIDKKDLDKAAVLSKTRHSTSFGINGGDEDITTQKSDQENSQKPYLQKNIL